MASNSRIIGWQAGFKKRYFTPESIIVARESFITPPSLLHTGCNNNSYAVMCVQRERPEKH